MTHNTNSAPASPSQGEEAPRHTCTEVPGPCEACDASPGGESAPPAKLFCDPKIGGCGGDVYHYSGCIYGEHGMILRACDFEKRVAPASPDREAASDMDVVALLDKLLAESGARVSFVLPVTAADRDELRARGIDIPDAAIYAVRHQYAHRMRQSLSSPPGARPTTDDVALLEDAVYRSAILDTSHGRDEARAEADEAARRIRKRLGLLAETIAQNVALAAAVSGPSAREQESGTTPCAAVRAIQERLDEDAAMVTIKGVDYYVADHVEAAITGRPRWCEWCEDTPLRKVDEVSGICPKCNVQWSVVPSAPAGGEAPDVEATEVFKKIERAMVAQTRLNCGEKYDADIRAAISAGLAAGNDALAEATALASTLRDTRRQVVEVSRVHDDMARMLEVVEADRQALIDKGGQKE